MLSALFLRAIPTVYCNSATAASSLERRRVKCVQSSAEFGQLSMMTIGESSIEFQTGSKHQLSIVQVFGLNMIVDRVGEVCKR